MTTHPNENTRKPCKQVRLSLAAGSVLIILPPFLIGLNAARHVIQKPETRVEKKEGRLRIDGQYPPRVVVIIIIITLFLLFRMVFGRHIFLQAFPFLDQLLPIFLGTNPPAMILVQILIRKIAQPLVVVRHA